MITISDEQVAAVLSMTEAKAALRSAFEQFGNDSGAVLARGRASNEFDGQLTTISSMGAVLPKSGVLGTKVYSTINGKFNFVMTLFSASTGNYLASMQANYLTRVRTAATTALALDVLAKGDEKVLAIFGAGVQAQAHIDAVFLNHQFSQVFVCARSHAEEFASRIATRYGVSAKAVDALTAASTADVIITCTRSNEALFDGNTVRPGCLVAAIGSSKPSARELDDVLLSRAAHIVVEWRPAAHLEAGELAGVERVNLYDRKTHELGKLLNSPLVRNKNDIVVYKSVGIGLEDVAIAKLVFDKLIEQRGHSSQGDAEINHDAGI